MKCDRGQPSCGWCSRNNANCEYKERKPPGLRAGFGRFLENRSRELELRLEKMEEILRQHSEILHTSSSLSLTLQRNLNTSAPTGQSGLPSDYGTPSDTSNMFKSSEPSRTPQADTSLLIQRQPSAFTHSSHQSMELGAHPLTPGIQDAFASQAKASSIPTSQISGLQPQSSVSQTDYYTSSQAGLEQSSMVSISEGNAPSAPDQEDLPPYKLLYALVDLFFKHVNTWCPILHRKATLDSLFGVSNLQESDRILLHAIVATTMRYSTDPKLTEERRQHYHRVSKQKVLLYGMENSSVQSLVALVILALDLCGSSNGPPGWNIMALITRSVVQLGLAVEPTSFSVAPHFTSIYTLRAMILPEPTDFIEEESRRRLFWMVYLLDRYATISTAFEFALDDKEIDRMLPCRDDLWMENQRVETRWFVAVDSSHEDLRRHHGDRPENMGAFAYYIEILGALSKIHKFLKQPIDIGAVRDVERWQFRYRELDQSLTTWKFSLPGEFGNMAKLFQTNSRNFNCSLVMLHSAYHTAIIRLHSSAAYPTIRSPIFTPSFSAAQKCLSAVENIVTLGEFVVNNGLLSKLGPPFAFTIWVAARLLLVHGSTVDNKLSPQISFLVETLRGLGRYWPVAEKYCSLLQRVLDEHRESEQKGDGITPSSVKILADMRRTAFDLDFLISRQPRHGTANQSRVASVATARAPAPNELEYLDVFDFFNVPRLPFGGDSIVGLTQAERSDTDMEATNNSIGHHSHQHHHSNDHHQHHQQQQQQQQGSLNEFNITNFMIDANSDWLFKSDGGKYMAST